MKRTCLLIVAALLAAPCPAQDLPLEVKGAGVKQVTLVEKPPFTVEAEKGAVLYVWKDTTGRVEVWSLNVYSIDVLHLAKHKGGELRVECTAIFQGSDAKLAIKTGTKIVNIGTLPGPGPSPDPTPDPDPSPVPIGPLRVIFVRESKAKMTTEQGHIWNSTQIAAYLNSKSVKDGNQPGWRKWDKDQPADKEVEDMQQLWADAKGKAVSVMPSIIIAVGTKAVVYPMPATEADTLALLKKHAEGK